MGSLVGKTVLAVTGWRPVRSLFTSTRPGRALSTRFVAGESLAEAAAAARTLNEGGARVSLDYLGEYVADVEQAKAALADYMACLDQIGESALDANISIKLTQLGMGLDDALAESSLRTLAERAGELGTSVTVDMEDSEYTETTIAIYERVQRDLGNVGVAVQSYLRRTRDDLDRLIPLGGHIRLCKGAYAEPEEVAYQSRAEVDASYDRLANLLMAAETVRPAMATHDDARLAVVAGLAGSRSGYFEYQMLYGIRADLQRQMISEGKKLRVYVPYGEAWYPYLTRRLAERPANIWFFLRALVGRR